MLRNSASGPKVELLGFTNPRWGLLIRGCGYPTCPTCNTHKFQYMPHDAVTAFLLAGDILNVAITDNVSPDRARKLNTAYDHDPRLLGVSIMDHYEYVMFGKVALSCHHASVNPCAYIVI